MSIIGDTYEEYEERWREKIRALYRKGGTPDYLKGLKDAYEVIRDGHENIEGDCNETK